MKFRDLYIGQYFDFIKGTPFDSFFKRCQKTSARGYVDSDGVSHRVGSVSANVYHVGTQA